MTCFRTIVAILVLVGPYALGHDVRFDVKYRPPPHCERADRVPVAMYVYYLPGLNVGGDAPEPQLLFAHWADGLAVSHLINGPAPAIGLLPPEDSAVLADLLESAPQAQSLTDEQVLQGSAVYVVKLVGDTYRKAAIPCAPVRSGGFAVGLSAALSASETHGSLLSRLHQRLETSAGWCIDAIDLRCSECNRSLLSVSLLRGAIPRGRVRPPGQPGVQPVPAAPGER